MWYLFLVLFIVAADQVAKALVQGRFAVHGSLPVLDGIFHLTYVQNTGAAFSILEGKQLFFIVFTSVLSAAILIYVLANRKRGKVFLLFSLSLIAAGGIGNLIDRIRFGYVVDFLDFQVWPVFNVADIAVTLGCLFVCLHVFFSQPKEQKKGKKA